ncbi:ASP-1 protein [Aphelenchoides avenae]|nr:ASP-1 protein [Aphelenchus avenae]
MGETQSVFGSLGLDTYNLSGLVVENVLFVLVETTSYQLNPSWPSDGIFSLTFNGEDLNDGPLRRILKSVGGKQEVSLRLRKPLQTETGTDSLITFGGKDTENCMMNWVSFASNKSAWSVPLANLQVGSKPVYRNKATASVSLSSPYLGVPYAYIHKLVAAIGAEYSFKLDLYTVDCKKVDDLPPIILVVGQGFTYTWNVLPRDYVVNKQMTKSTVCALLIVPDDNAWSIGSQFLPKSCVHLDFANNKIGFADAAK